MNPQQNVEPQDVIIMEDDGNTTANSGLSIKQIILEQYKRCIIEGSKEMVRGGIAKRWFQDKYIDVEQPNQREIFRNCVKLLDILLTPFSCNKEHIKLLLETNTKETEDLFKEFYKRQQFIYEDMEKLRKGNQDKFNNVAWDTALKNLLDEHEMNIVRKSQDRLITLSSLLSELNYLDEGSVSN